MPPLRVVIDHERFERFVEQARRVAVTRHRLPRLAKQPAQFGEDQLGPGDGFASQYLALELDDQSRSRIRRKLTQKIAQPINGRGASRHGLYPVSLTTVVAPL